MPNYLLYRISSNSTDKQRVLGIGKLDCLSNLVRAFPSYRMICLADNCSSDLIERLKSMDFFHLEITRLGQANAFRHLVNHALTHLKPDDWVYFIEDDYLHVQDAEAIMEEAKSVFDYVTLYDHPDKYGVFQGPKNPYVKHPKLSEATQVLKAKHRIWRTTNSTTHSFACSVQTLRHDKALWLGQLAVRKRLQDFYDWIFLTQPGFHQAQLKFKLRLRQAASKFFNLSRRQRRTLGVPMPSAAAHLEEKLLPDNFGEVYYWSQD